MDRLESMSTLVAAVEAGSLSAASRKLGMPLATVSRKVSELEAHLKTRVVNRTSRRLTLTDAGRSYIAACKRIVDEFLTTSYKPGMTAEELEKSYKGFGEDPFILVLGGIDKPVKFSAWNYAKDRSQTLAPKGNDEQG